MNQHTVIASAILAAAIVGGAWLMKPIQQPSPIQQPCWESRESGPTAVMLNKCTGEMWVLADGGTIWNKAFTAK
jgi:hypothetical protein